MTARTRFAILLCIFTLVALPACGTTGAESETQSYEVTEPVQRLVVEAEAGEVAITLGDGPVRVTETVHYQTDKPQTSHSVAASTLQLTENGCATNDWRCHVEFDVRVPAATVVDVKTVAGAVRLRDLAGDVTVVTQAGAIEATSLSSDRVSVATEAGAASLEFVEPPTDVKASTELGAIVVKVPQGVAYAVRVDAEVGGAQVRVDQDPASAHKISATTQVGGVRVENG
jgi:DUF4097 and DUF4098 domain-containing protein YvlB